MRHRLPSVLTLLVVVACGERPTPRTADSSAPARAAAANPSTPPAAPDSTRGVAVTVGSPEEGIDACSVGAVRATGQGKRWVAVRSGPGAGFPVVDSLQPGATYHSCDAATGWTGIVYRRDSDLPDSTGSCGGLSSPIAERRTYKGPCRSGWIAEGAEKVIAG